jgi:hypothetical protein
VVGFFHACDLFPVSFGFALFFRKYDASGV